MSIKYVQQILIKKQLTLEHPNGIKSESSVMTASTYLLIDKKAI